MWNWLADKAGKVIEWFVDEAIVKPVERIVEEAIVKPVKRIVDEVEDVIDKLKKAFDETMEALRKAFKAIERLIERIFGGGIGSRHHGESVLASVPAAGNASANNASPVEDRPNHIAALTRHRLRLSGLGELLAALLLFGAFPSLFALLQLCTLAPAGGFDFFSPLDRQAWSVQDFLGTDPPVRPITPGFDGVMPDPSPWTGTQSPLPQDDMRNRIMVIATQRQPLPPRDDPEALRWYREVEARIALLDLESLLGRLVEYEPGVFDNYLDPMDYVLEAVLREMLAGISVEPQPKAAEATMTDTVAPTEVVRQAPKTAPKVAPETITTELVSLGLQSAEPPPNVPAVTTQTTVTKVPEGSTVTPNPGSQTSSPPMTSSTVITGPTTSETKSDAPKDTPKVEQPAADVSRTK